MILNVWLNSAIHNSVDRHHTYSHRHAPVACGLCAEWRFWEQLECLVFACRQEIHPGRLILLPAGGLYHQRDVVRVIEAADVRINLRDDLPVTPPVRGNLK